MFKQYKTIPKFTPGSLPKNRIWTRSLDALKNEGCKQVFTDKVSGVKATKPNFEKLMEYVRPGDTIVIGKLDGTGHPATWAQHYKAHRVNRRAKK